MSKQVTVGVAFLFGGAALAAAFPAAAEDISDQAAAGGLISYQMFREAETAYGQGDYMNAFRLFLPLAEPCRAFKISENESPLPRDRPETVGCFPMAATYLSQMFRRGLGVQQNSDLASEWSAIAATVSYTGLEAPVIPEGANGGGGAGGPGGP